MRVDPRKVTDLCAKGLTLRAAAREFGISHERVRQILAQDSRFQRCTETPDEWQRLSHGLAWQYGAARTDAIFDAEDAATEADLRAWRKFGRAR